MTLSPALQLLGSLAKKIFPWIITVAAVVSVTRDLDWPQFFEHAKDIELTFFGATLLMLLISYPLRSVRWRSLFPHSSRPGTIAAYRVLVLGFFMNNILPARAGEIVRAHVGGKLFRLTRTEVLSTIAGERLIDGLSISLMFLCSGLALGDDHISRVLFSVAIFFGAATLGTLATLLIRKPLFKALRKLGMKHAILGYGCSRVEIFIEGLAPIFSARTTLNLILWSAIIWGVELVSYMTVSAAFGLPLSLPQAIFFMVAVNFSSLIPAAPGGIGVVEAVGSAVLVQLTDAGKEMGLAIVLTIHVLQYLVVGIPGIVVMLGLKKADINAIAEQQ